MTALKNATKNARCSRVQWEMRRTHVWRVDCRQDALFVVLDINIFALQLCKNTKQILLNLCLMYAFVLLRA